MKKKNTLLTKNSWLRLWILRILTHPESDCMDDLCRERYARGSKMLSFLGVNMRKNGNQPLESEDIREMLLELREQMEERVHELQLEPEMAHNLKLIRKLFVLSKIELSILCFSIYLYRFKSHLDRAMDLIQPHDSGMDDIIGNYAYILGYSVEEVRAVLRRDSKLISKGLVKWDGSRCSYSLRPAAIFGGRLLRDYLTEDYFMRLVASSPLSAELTIEDFPHLKDILNDLCTYLRVALKNGTRGVNILLYGPPGTGKTEISRLLGRKLRCTVREVISQDADGDPLCAKEKLQTLCMAQALFNKRRMILVFDEAEDVFRGEYRYSRGQGNQHKAWMNSVLETKALPVVWISNTHQCIDSAFLRRFDFVIEVPTLPAEFRQKNYNKISGNVVSQSVLEQISTYDHLTPAIVSRASKVTGQIHAGKTPAADETFLRLVKGTLQAQGHRVTVKSQKSARQETYDLSFAHTDVALDSLVHNISKDSACRICLYGHPGTGKTAFGHWLSKHLNLPIHSKKVSDIVSPYVGVTERNLAECFEEARKAKAILMIDEIDSFLQNRSHAARSWEITQVNELLTQMEEFEGIFIGSTNMMDGLDLASLRRFDLKIRFDYLLPEQTVKLFEMYCQKLNLGQVGEDVMEKLTRFTNLTPGDFANTARQHRFRKFTSPQDLLVALQHESHIKTNNAPKRIAGFMGG